MKDFMEIQEKLETAGRFLLYTVFILVFVGALLSWTSFMQPQPNHLTPPPDDEPNSCVQKCEEMDLYAILGPTCVCGYRNGTPAAYPMNISSLDTDI